MKNSGIMSLFCSVLENISGIMCLPLAILTIVFKNEISLTVISALRQEDLKFKAAFILSQTAKTKKTNQTVFQCRHISEHQSKSKCSWLERHKGVHGGPS